MYECERHFHDDHIETRIHWRGKDTRLDQVLCLVYPGSSRKRIFDLIDSGVVEVPRGSVKKSRLVQPGDTLILRRARWVEASVADPVIIHDLNDIVIFDKPSGLTVHPSGRYQYNTLSRLFPDLKLCHRIDRETSGILVTARTAHMANIMMEKFRNRKTLKFYIAKLSGEITWKHQRVDVPIGKDENSSVRLKQGHNPAGDDALTDFWHLQDGICLVQIHTGRQHQIRVHSAHIGHHLQGDLLYQPNGGDVLWDQMTQETLEEWKEEQFRVFEPNFHLHAAILSGCLEETIFCKPSWLHENLWTQACEIFDQVLPPHS